MKLKKFSVILAVLLVAILAIGAVSAESVSDTDVAAVDDTAGTVSVDDSIDDVSVDTTDNDVKNSLSAVALEDGESVSYEINDTSYSTYFNVDGTATDELSDMGGYTLNIGTLTNKDIKIISGSDINITGNEGNLITNGTITIGDGTGSAASIIISGLTFENTNKIAVDILDLTNDVTVKNNNMHIIGIGALSSDPYFSVYGVSSNGYVTELSIEDNTFSVEGDARYTYAIEVGSTRADWSYADSNPAGIYISGNTIIMNTSEGAKIAEPMYLSDVLDATVVNNYAKVNTVGNTVAYGIQIGDSAFGTMYEDEYEGDLTSPNDVLIDSNVFVLNSEFMIYGISVLDSGWDSEAYTLYSFPLNITISNNEVYANSKKGVMGIAGQIYNLTVTDNTVVAFGGSSEGLDTGDSLGNDTVALEIQYSGSTTHTVLVKDNKVFTNVTKEKATNNENGYVTFENNEDLTEFTINDETYSIFFNDDGTTDVLKDLEDYTLMIGTLTNKDIVLDSGSEIDIIGLEMEGFIRNGTIVLDGVSDVYVSELVFVNVNKDAFNIEDGSNEIVIVDNALILAGNDTEAGVPYFSLYAIRANGFITGLNITDNSIYVTGDAPYSYGIALWASDATFSPAEFNPQDITIFNNSIELDLSEGSTMAEAIYLDCPSDATVEENNITITTVGDAFAYGIQVSDSLPSAYKLGYRGELTSPESVTITGNTLNISSEYMIYGITVLSDGALVNESEDLAYCQFELFLTVSENTIYANSTKGVIALAGKVYNITMNDNLLYVTGGDDSDVVSLDALGVGTYAVGIDNNGYYAEDYYYTYVIDNNITSNVAAEYINDETVLDEYVFFDNYIPLDLGIVLESDKDALLIGDIINYTITVVNNGPNVATDVFVSFELSDILLLVSAPEEYDTDLEILNVSDLAVGEEKEYNIIAQVIDGGYLLSTVYVDCYQDDTYMDNNTANLDMITVPVIIDDSNYDEYFDEVGCLKDDVIADGTVVLFGNLTNKDLLINVPLLISAYEDSKLVNTTIALVQGADSTVISGLVFDYTAEDSGFAIISVNDGVNDVLIKSNNITAVSVPAGYDSAIGIAVYGAEDGSEDVTIEDNLINITGDCLYTYGISVQSYDQIWVKGEGASHVEILENRIILMGTGLEEAIYLADLYDVYVYKNIMVSVSAGEYTGSDAYGIAAANVTELIIEENQIGAISKQMAFGVAITTGSDEVDVFNNTIYVIGTGAIGIGVQDSEDVSVTFNTIYAYGADFTSIETYDSLGTANAAILDFTEEALIENNTISEHFPLVIDDDNYDTYFDELGYVKEGSGIEAGDLIFLDELSNKDLVIDMPLLIKGYPLNFLVNTTIALVDGANGTSIIGMNMDYYDEGSTDFVIISISEGVSNVLIDNNVIITHFLPGWKYNAGISVYGATEGSKNITIHNNYIEMTGDNGGLYGIDVQNYDSFYNEGNGTTGLYILNNFIQIDCSGMAEPIYIMGCNDVLVDGNTLVSSTDGGDAYGIGTSKINNFTVTNNAMLVVSENNMAYGVASPDSTNVVINDNNITAAGIGAIGIGFITDENVEIKRNIINITGGDYTTLTTYEQIGTGNAAILDVFGNTGVVIEDNTIFEDCPITINDDNYDTYFDESGFIRNDSGIEAEDLIFLDELTNKKLNIDIPLTIKGVPLNALVNTTITILPDAGGSNICNLNMEFTGDNTTGSVGIIYVYGASDVEISGNTIIVPDFVDKAGSKYGSSVYAIEVESGEYGCSFIDITDNIIDIRGSARYLYGIDVFQTWQAPMRNSDIAISDNYISVIGASRMSEAIYASEVDELEITGNTITSIGEAAAYGIGTDSLTDSIIADNGMEVVAGTQAYGITNTYSDGVEILANVISSTGEGAIGIGTNSENVTIAKNQITITGKDYTIIPSSDVLGTDNAAILDLTGEATIENNTITENCPITINDGNYATYFDENGDLKNDSGISDGDLIFLGELSNKKFHFDNFLIIKGANNNKLVNTTIALTAGASGSTLNRLTLEFTGDNTTGSVGLIYVYGASDIEISQNTITVIDFVDKEGAKYGSSVYAIEIESGEDGCSFIDIMDNVIDISGSARYLYGIDVFQSWQAPMRNSDISIKDNLVMIDPASRMSEGIYASGIDNAVIVNNTVISESDAAAYGIGTDSLVNSTIADNVIKACAETQAYGITNTHSTNVDIVNNTVTAIGIGAVGIGFMGSEGVTVADNTINITGGDYTSITSADSLGTANAAILDKDNKGTISYNNVTENIPLTINDGNYDNYFDENGRVRNDSGIEDDDLVFFEKLSNKNIVLDIPLIVKGAPGNKVVNTTFLVLVEGSGSAITCLNMEFTGDNTTGSVGIIYILGASDVEVSYNNITVPNFVDKAGAKYGSSLYAIEVESDANGCSFIDIKNNIIDISGSARYLYGIDVFQTWQAPNKNSFITINDNEISIESASRMSEGIYASGIELAVITNNTINSVGDAAAYGIGTDNLVNSTIADNDVVVLAGTQAYGITSTNSDGLEVIYNNISAVGIGAIGIGSDSANVNIDKNEISILGQDYTAISSADSLGTGNAAILDKGTKTTIGNNTIEEIAPIIVEDKSYDRYFDENGQIKEDAPIGSGDIVYLGVLTNKDMVFDIPVAILPATVSKLTDSTIKVVEGADGTLIDGLNIEYTGDENTGSKNIIYVTGASDVTISNNNITVPDFVNKAGSKYGSSVAAIAVESGATGTDNTTITGNNIEVNGTANYLYGIDAYTTWGANTTNSNLKIANNNVSVNGGARMAEAVYVSDSKNVTIDNNNVGAASDAAAYGIATDQLSHAKITDNDVAVLAGTTGYGITATTSGEDVLIESNDVGVLGMSAIGVGLSNQDAVIVKDNKIDIIGGDYSSVASADNLGTANAAILDKDNKNTNLVVENNTMTENGKAVNTTHSGNSSAELQAIIDAAPAGSTVDLDGVIYAGISNVVIDKNLTITNGTIVGKAGEAIFVIPAKSENGPDEVNINGMVFFANDATVIAKATADNGTTPTSIDTPAISIKNNTIDLANVNVVPESVTVLELDSERGILAPTSEIAVEGNTIATGVDPFEFRVTGVADDSGNIVVDKGGNIPAKKASVIHYQDMNTTAVNSKIEGRVGKYFEVNLTDTDGNPLANQFVQIGFNGVVYNRTTNETGGVKLQINLGYKGTYTFAISYLGDDNYNGSFVVSKIVVSTQNTKITTSSKTYKASAKTKTLTATLKSSVYNTAINGKKVTFTVNGKSYSATTNAKGVATVKVSLSTKKTYSFTAKFAGDDMYTKSSVTGKVIIK